MAICDGAPAEAATNVAQEAPPRKEGSGTHISIANWNIRDGRGGGLESATRALRSMNVNIAVVQEEKLLGGMHNRLLLGYAVMVIDVRNTRFGGFAFLWEESELYELEEAKARGPNVVSFKIQIGTYHYYVVECYIPPSNVAGTTLMCIEQAMAQMPKGCTPLIVGDLNVYLDYPRNDRDKAIADAMDAHDVSYFTRHFGHRRGRLI